MSFLYRSADLAPAGIDPKDTRILIEDIPPMAVVAIGMRGAYKLNRVKNGVSQLRGWLSQQSDWEEAGEPRALFYNGPEARKRDLWSELQIPVRRR
jgi:DNA gyrase inhibitor GyrI